MNHPADSGSSRFVGSWTRVQALVAVIIGLVAWVLTIGRQESAPPIHPLLLSAFGPYVAILVCTSVPRWRVFGLGMAAGGAGAFTVVATPFALIASLLLGFATNGTQLVSGMAMLALVPLHAALAYTAYSALASSSQRPFAIAVGFSAVAAYAMCAVAIDETVSTRQARIRREAQRPTTPASASASSVAAASASALATKLRSCVMSTSATPKSPPRIVDDLGPNGAACATDAELRPADGAYAVRVASSPGQDAPAAFTVCVTTRNARNRLEAHAFDERSTVSTMRAELPDATPVQACAAAFAEDRLRAVRYCLWEYAATHDAAFPPALDVLSTAEGGTCLPHPPSRGAEGGFRHAYAPGRRDDRGRITSFVLIEGLPGSTRAGDRRRYLDETGVIRATAEARLPTATDVPDSRPLEEQFAAQELNRAGVFTLERRCAKNQTAADCIRLGAAFEARRDRWADVTTRRYTPSGGLASAVPAGAGMAARDRQRAIEAYRTACTLGAADACEHAARLLALAPDQGAAAADVTTLQMQGCALGSIASCEALDAAGGRPAHLTGAAGVRF